jgi:hypothetical protein
VILPSLSNMGSAEISTHDRVVARQILRRSFQLDAALVAVGEVSGGPQGMPFDSDELWITRHRQHLLS